MEFSHLAGSTVIVLIAGIAALFFVNDKYKPSLALFIVIINALLTSIPSVIALTSATQSFSFIMPHMTGEIAVRIDSLSAWFILIINFTTINGIIYGKGYLKSYSHLPVNLQIHWAFYILFHISMIWVCMLEHGLAFIVAWELMSLSSLMLVIFEYQNKETLKAGLNYMVQMHLSVIFLTIGFIWLYFSTGTFNFTGLALLQESGNAIWIFLFLFVGFAIKAGFIPFHSWLPHAHPAAPSHISGVMSGVIVKLGIYGIIRIVSYLKFEWLLAGEIILSISILTAIYGIAYAAVKLDFKRMLAFCTIENIGIIGIGIGLGLIGLGTQNNTLILLGFASALLHTLNHSLFKSLLFFSAGSVYQQTHTRNIESLGGLIKKMPVTAVFFLIGAMAIGGLPPFNGFVSEFLVFTGLVKGMTSANGISHTALMVLSMAGLALVGGISLLTFTKNFGVIFLGSPRKELHHEPKETPFLMHLPQYLIVAVMLSIAVFPQFFLTIVTKIVSNNFSIDLTTSVSNIYNTTTNIANVGKVSLLFISFLLVLYGLRWLLLRKRESEQFETWGCGYTSPITKAQYTGRSFARSFGSLMGFMVKEQKSYSKIPKPKLYPGIHSFTTSYFDLIEKKIIIPITRRLTFSLNYFQFIQNGHIQSYIIYGLFFIMLIFIGTLFHLIH